MTNKGKPVSKQQMYEIDDKCMYVNVKDSLQTCGHFHPLNVLMSEALFCRKRDAHVTCDVVQFDDES